MWCVRVCHGWDDMMCGGCYRYLYMTSIGRVVVARVFVWRDVWLADKVEVLAATTMVGPLRTRCTQLKKGFGMVGI